MDLENFNESDWTQISDLYTTTHDYQEFTADLSAFRGKTVYVAIRHFSVTDQFFLNIDDITLPLTVPPVFAVTLAANSAEVVSVVLDETELNPETDYTVSYMQGETVLDAAPTAPGSYTAVITGMGDYAGTIRQPFTINPVISIVNPAENGGTVHVFADYDPETGGTELSDGDAVTAGTVLTLIADPDAGYQLKNISVRDGEENEIPLTAGQFTMSAEDVTVSAEFEKIPPTFEKYCLTLSGQIGVNFYLDLSSLTDEEKAAGYMEFTVNGRTTKDTFDAECKNQSGKYYGFTCYVTSVQMADTITAVYHYGDGQTVKKIYSVLEYINKIESNSDLYDEKTLDLIHAIADYGFYAQPWLASCNNWTVDTDHTQIDKHYSDSYDFAAIKRETEQYKRVLIPGDSDIEKITYSLSLDAETTLYVFVKPNDGYTGDVAITITRDGEATSYTAVRQSDGRYKISIPNISAHRLGETYDITAATDKGTAVS